jgi:hypothetical protein
MTVRDEIVRALELAVRDMGDVIFAQSQVYVPRDDSTLAHSGSIEYLPDGVIIRYRAIHAAAVERGHGPVVIRNPVRRQVRTYMRMDSTGRPQPVRQYDRVYQTGAIGFLRHGGRNIGFRVLGTEEHPIPAQEGVWYMARAAADGVRVFPDIAEKHLRRLLEK